MNQFSFFELRQLSGMSVEEIAPELGYSASTVYRWERGEIAPKAAVFRALQSLLEFSPARPASHLVKLCRKVPSAIT